MSSNEPNEPVQPGATDDGSAATAVLDPTPPEAMAAAPAAVPVRVCPACSAQERTSGPFCPHCGASYERRKRRRFSKRVRIIGAATVALLVLGGAGAGVGVKLHHDSVVKHRKEARAAEAASAAAAARQQAAAKARQQRLTDTLKRTERASLVRSLQRSVTKDAQKDVNDGLLNGTILRTECTPVGGGNTDDLAAHTGDYTCMAVTKDNADGTSSGYRFSATVNYDDFTYTWHLGG